MKIPKILSFPIGGKRDKLSSNVSRQASSMNSKADIISPKLRRADLKTLRTSSNVSNERYATLTAFGKGAHSIEAFTGFKNTRAFYAIFRKKSSVIFNLSFGDDAQGALGTQEYLF